MADIGGVVCDFVRGIPAELKDRVDLFQVAGQDGFGAQLLGKGDSPFRFEAVKYDTAANVKTWAENIQAKQGTIVTIVNDWGESYPKMLIRIVEPPVKIAARVVGTAKDARGIVRIRGVKLP